MPLQTYTPNFTVIDLDPHWGRVLRYFRPSDWLVLAGTALVGPAIYAYDALLSRHDANTPWRVSRSQLNARFFRGFTLPTLLSALGGFFVAYHRSSERFWGWTENEPEIQRDRAEFLAARRCGRTHHLGESELTPHLKQVAYDHSRFAAEAFVWLPLLNFTHHNLGVNWDLYKDLQV